jgi:hypothetical protein
MRSLLPAGLMQTRPQPGEAGSGPPPNSAPRNRIASTRMIHCLRDSVWFADMSIVTSATSAAHVGPNSSKNRAIVLSVRPSPAHTRRPAWWSTITRMWWAHETRTAHGCLLGLEP